MKSARPIRLVLLASMLAGCAQEIAYREMTANKSYGYKDHKRDDGSYVLLVVYPAANYAAALAYKYWDKRAGELCQGRAFHKNIFRADRPTVHYSNYGGMPGSFELEGYLTCDPH